MNAALYIRVSTEEQAREGYSIAAQKERLLSFCQAQGWTPTGIYADEGHSGATLARPELSRLRRDAAQGNINLVLVWKVDRLSRKVAHLAQLVEEFDRHGVGLRSLTEPFDTSHAAGRAFLQMLGVFAELERENIRERSKLGIRKRVQQGFVHGRPTMIGYRFAGKGRVEIDPGGAEVVRWIFNQYLQGVGTLRIAQQLVQGVPGLQADILYREFRHVSPHSVRDRVAWILKNPIYAGWSTVNGERFPGRHQAIIDPETFERVQQLLQSRQKLPNRAHTSRYILTGLIFCGACGSPMFGFRQPNRARSPTAREARPYYEYYCCRNSSGFQGRSKTCTNWGIIRESAEHQVIAQVRKLALHPEQFQDLVPQALDDTTAHLQEERRKILALLGQAEKKQKRWIDAIEQAPELEATALARLRDIAREQKELTDRLATVERELRNGGAPLDRDEALKLLGNVAQVIDHAEPDQLREILRTFVKRAIVMPGPEGQKQVRVEFFPL
ncbi:MAG: recombinase family protein [Bacillota bacterium]|nr:recombinase family protein [Bacillota bacterium]